MNCRRWECDGNWSTRHRAHFYDPHQTVTVVEIQETQLGATAVTTVSLEDVQYKEHPKYFCAVEVLYNAMEQTLVLK